MIIWILNIEVRIFYLRKILSYCLDDRTYQCNECGLMYATRGDLRQHITKVHRCGVYANIPAGGLSIRQRPYSSSSKNSQRSLSTSPIKQTNSRRETIYRCSLCRSKFTHLRAIERHHYDVHRIDPFDVEAMKNATIEDEEIIENEQIQEQDINHRDDEEQMAIIQFRNQHQNPEQSPLIVKIERGFFPREFSIFYFDLFCFSYRWL